MSAFDTIKVLLPAVLAFLVGIGITPTLSNFMYKHKMWRSVSRSKENTEAMSVDFQKIHNEKDEVNTPRTGGALVWLSVLITMILLYMLAFLYPNSVTTKLSFLSRNQTLLPFVALMFASFVGLADDFLQIYGKNKETSNGLPRALRILVVLLIGTIGAWWFYFKLNVLSVHVPFLGDLSLGLFFIPFFMLVMLGVFSGSVIDGIDGLAAGVMAASYGAFMLVAFSQNQIDLAAFCAVIVGGLLAFLWFNIPPARFYLGETGMLGLTVTLSIVAFLTKEPLLIPIIAFPLFITSVSSSVQMFSKKYFGKKIFKIAPLHHHFEAIGWSRAKVTMRYWVISVIMAILGTILAILGK
jgi:phospho-N-acetylmuramoyl-pentapeptide-transferase